MYSTNNGFTHFSDRFGGKSNRFHAAARIEASADDERRLNDEIRDILEAASARDLRWKDLDGAKERFAAQKLFEFAAREMREGKLHVDIEVRDMHGSERDAINHTCAPDRKVAGGDGSARTSDDAPSISRLAGLFAGLVAFSYEKRDEYEAWLRRSSPQCALFSNEVAEFLPSKVSIERFQVLRHFLDTCAAEGLPVSLATARGLITTSLSNTRWPPIAISFKVD